MSQHKIEFTQIKRIVSRVCVTEKNYIILVLVSLLTFLVSTVLSEKTALASGANSQTEGRGLVGKKLITSERSTSTEYQTIPAALRLTSPHRVVSVHSSQATDWDGSGHPYDHMNPTEVRRMVGRGVMELTGKSTAVEAWRELIPYQSGEAVAIKLNFNNTWANFTEDPKMNPYPALVNATIAGLKSIGIPSNKIWLTDPSRVPNDSFRSRIEDPNVLYYTRASATQIGARPNVFTTGFVEDNSTYSTQGDRGDGVMVWINPADVFVNAAHIINMPQLKGHGGASITLGLKNHFGSVDFTESATGSHPYHSYFYVGGSHYSPNKNILADISNNPVFRNKTRLIIGDGLMGHPRVNYQDPVLWNSFGNNPPEILFFGVDPIAVDSVMLDYLLRENSSRNDDILRYAASTGLGVFEHWNNSTERRYSVIDYVEVEFDSAGDVAPAPPENLRTNPETSDNNPP